MDIGAKILIVLMVIIIILLSLLIFLFCTFYVCKKHLKCTKVEHEKETFELKKTDRSVDIQLELEDLYIDDTISDQVKYEEITDNTKHSDHIYHVLECTCEGACNCATLY